MAIGAPTKLFDAVETVEQAVQYMWTWQRLQDQNPHMNLPVSHLYGNAQKGNELPLGEILPGAIPLADDCDRYRLIAEFEGWQNFEAWFGDASPLKVWMRQSDLDAKRFDRAWCIIRTD